MKTLTSLSRYAVVSLLFASLLSVAAGAQEQLSEASAKRLQAQAEECGRAFIEGNFERLADCTLPRLVELMGGREKLLEVVRKDVAEMKADGFEPLSSVSSAPTQVLLVGSQTYAVLPLKFKMRTSKEIHVSDSFMIGVSGDGGQNWKFLSADSTDEARMKVLLPDVVGKLKLPPAKYSTEPLPAKP
ncbi:MAG: hypothetical protein ABW208_22860 [Pyrinomonadaceae bacterium]